MATKKKDKEQALGYYVAKANDIVRTRYDLTLEQQKCLLYIISKIKPDDVITGWYEFTLTDLCDALNIKLDAGGYYYTQLKKDIEILTHRTLFKMPDGHLKTMSWLGDFDVMPLSNSVRVCFNPNMEQYLFELRQHYTQFRLQDALVYKSVYSLRLFEILKSYTTVEKLHMKKQTIQVRFQLPKLKEMLALDDKYDRWVDFDKRVLKRAKEEINACSEDIHIEYVPEKTGKKITGVTFLVAEATYQQMMAAYEESKRRLNFE